LQDIPEFTKIWNFCFETTPSGIPAAAASFRPNFSCGKQLLNRVQEVVFALAKSDKKRSCKIGQKTQPQNRALGGERNKRTMLKNSSAPA
jgi:hypothetical protein